MYHENVGDVRCDVLYPKPILERHTRPGEGVVYACANKPINLGAALSAVRKITFVSFTNALVRRRFI